MKERESILICGLPGSGNRLVQRFLDRQGFKTLLWHGGNEDLWRDWEQEHKRLGFDHAVMPVRKLWWASRQRQLDRPDMAWYERQGYENVETLVAFFRQGVLHYLAMREIPLFAFDYETLVASPIRTAWAIQKALGHADEDPWSWDETIVDGDEKYREELVGAQ